jgi:hypothetical protein
MIYVIFKDPNGNHLKGAMFPCIPRKGERICIQLRSGEGNNYAGRVRDVEYQLDFMEKTYTTCVYVTVDPYYLGG